VIIAALVDELTGKGAVAILGVILGSSIGWMSGRWKRYQERRSILSGDARDTVVIQQHIVDSTSDSAGKKIPKVLRMRSLGQSEVSRVVPNGHLAAELLHRAFQVTPRDTLISMEGATGSYLLETLTNFVCDRVGNEPFDHDLYVMAPCCEPAEMVEHQPIIILLIAINDLALFEEWPNCRGIQVEHGSDGGRVLTLMELARRYRQEQKEITSLREAGMRTRHHETMYILDLALDRRTAPIPAKPIPWGRFEMVLRELNLE
jgi:hypothetical protein